MKIALTLLAMLASTTAAAQYSGPPAGMAVQSWADQQDARRIRYEELRAAIKARQQQPQVYINTGGGVYIDTRTQQPTIILDGDEQ